MAEKLIVQLAVEQLADRERSCEEEVQKEKSSESDDGLPGMIVFSCFFKKFVWHRELKCLFTEP